MDNNAIKIRQAVQERGITALYHFTPFPNVPSILTHGLLSRAALDERNLSYWYTDGWRGDGSPSALSMSIQDVSWPMFRSKLRNSLCQWAIIETKSSVLWTHHCRFCWTNAASAEIARHNVFLGGPWGFGRMFKDCPAEHPQFPTRVDAEVQVFTPIAPDLIVDVTVARERDKDELEAWMKANDRIRPVVVSPDVFTRR